MEFGPVSQKMMLLTYLLFNAVVLGSSLLGYGNRNEADNIYFIYMYCFSARAIGSSVLK